MDNGNSSVQELQNCVSGCLNDIVCSQISPCSMLRLTHYNVTCVVAAIKKNWRKPFPDHCLLVSSYVCIN